MPDSADWKLVARDAGDMALRLMMEFWPGALTLVLWRRDDIPDFIGPATRKIALRVPAHDALRRILARTGPIATTSANLSGEPAASNPSDVLEQFGDGLDLLLDGGALPLSAPSTVVDASAADPVILRPGAIDEDAIATALGDRTASLRFRVTRET
jgi:tRNA threonylcarbamoyl adenosine modification protein (Sua5/YciO/YrdC/YwlC family)